MSIGCSYIGEVDQVDFLCPLLRFQADIYQEIARLIIALGSWLRKAKFKS